MKYIEAKKENLTEVEKIYSIVYSELPYEEEWAEENVLAKVHELYKAGKKIIAVENKEIIGFICYQKKGYKETDWIVMEKRLA